MFCYNFSILWHIFIILLTFWIDGGLRLGPGAKVFAANLYAATLIPIPSSTRSQTVISCSQNRSCFENSWWVMNAGRNSASTVTFFPWCLGSHINRLSFMRRQQVELSIFLLFPPGLYLCLINRLRNQPAYPLYSWSIKTSSFLRWEWSWSESFSARISILFWYGWKIRTYLSCSR